MINTNSIDLIKGLIWVYPQMYYWHRYMYYWNYELFTGIGNQAIIIFI